MASDDVASNICQAPLRDPRRLHAAPPRAEPLGESLRSLQQQPVLKAPASSTDSRHFGYSSQYHATLFGHVSITNTGLTHRPASV
jgi:hypothetical protein